MSIGAGIALFAIGAILVFAVNIDLGWLNLDMVGYILMIAGAVVFLMGIILLFRRRRTDTVTRTVADPAVPGTVRDSGVTHRVTRQTDDTAGL
jgi:membrane-bound ClpP family serine protease